MTRNIKVASIQAAPVGYDLPATLDKVDKLVTEAASQGARLIVLPEAFLSAYPRHTGGYYVGSRSEEQREWFARYVRVCVVICASLVALCFGHLARTLETRGVSC
jgi:predicted amidohydrolase